MIWLVEDECGTGHGQVGPNALEHLSNSTTNALQRDDHLNQTLNLVDIAQNSLHHDHRRLLRTLRTHFTH